MEAYLDNAATTKASKTAVEAMEQVLLVDYGNPSSLHKMGMAAERHLKDAKKQISALLKCEPSELIFTSGGTEANNMALLGAALANRRAGNHIITTKIEHASVHQPLLFLQEMGFSVSFVPADAAGRVDLEAFAREIRDDTILASVMYVNNEIGSVEPVKEISALLHKKKSNILLHVDGVQAFGKLRICPEREGIDLLSASGHKIHGPKGSGFLYVKSGTKIKPILYGGGQEKGMRSGTENVPAVVGFAHAAAEAYAGLEAHREHLFCLKQRLVERLLAMEGVTVHGIPKEGLFFTAPHIVSAGFLGVRSEVLLHALEERGVYASSGSACSSNHPAVSGTLSAIGVARELLDATLRFSFSVHTAKEEVEYAADQIEALLPTLRRFSRR